jgi:hypothetical protein
MFIINPFLLWLFQITLLCRALPKHKREAGLCDASKELFTPGLQTGKEYDQDYVEVG